MRRKIKIVEIGPYPPPGTGWSVRIKKLKEAFIANGHDCLVLNTGENRKLKSSECLDVQNAFDYLLKLFMLKWKGYSFHIHTNAQSEKGPFLHLAAHLISLLFLEKASITFHGGYRQLYFPKKFGSRIYPIIYLNFLFSKVIICNDLNIKKSIAAYGAFIDPDKVFPIQAFSAQYLDTDNAVLPKSIADYMKNKTHMVLTYIALRNGFFLDAMVECIEKSSDQIGFVIVGAGKLEDKEIEAPYQAMLALEKKEKLLLVKALSHDEFITAMNRADIYLRTPDSDGISSSVLEALAAGTVVVACKNGRRPQGVVTYQPDDADEMLKKIQSVLRDLKKYQNEIQRPDIKDTIIEEVELLINAYVAD